MYIPAIPPYWNIDLKLIIGLIGLIILLGLIKTQAIMDYRVNRVKTDRVKTDRVDRVYRANTLTTFNFDSYFT